MLLKRGIREWLFLAMAVVGGTSARAGDLEWTHFGLRPLGMGNAYVAVADDYNALFYNPAGLARLKEWDGELLNPALAISSNTSSFIADLQELAGSGSGNTEDLLEVLEAQAGKTHHFSLGLTPHLIFKGFGIGIGLQLATTMAVHREISVDLEAGPRLIMPISFAMNFFEERLAVGLSAKLVGRAGVNREFSINDIQAFTKNENDATGPKLDDFVEGGYGAGVDFGILFTPIKTMEPTLGLSITDLGGTPYEKANVSGEATAAPELRLPSVNTGISIKPIVTGSMYLLCSADAHAINQPEHYSKKFNLGAEWGYGKIIKVQGGLHQGELSAGLQFDVGLLNLRLATYTEQLGPVAGQDEDLRDRRYALQLKLLI
jgi:hypothetical protein